MISKKISKSDIIGDKGIALIHRIVSEMGFIWTPTGLEAGIDGYIELRDYKTGEVSNFIIQVQSKTTEHDFQAETAESFEYVCAERDLNYWLGGNAPVILIRSRPSTNEAYWVSIKDYFKNLSRRSTRKIYFNKLRDRFDMNCRENLIDLAKPQDSGIYLSPLPKHEKLYCNLIKVVGFAEHIYVADSDFRFPGPLWNTFNQMGVVVGGEWILKGKRLISLHNLAEYPWCEICDQGTLESFNTSEWAYSNDPDVQRDFVRLLNQCLKQKLWPDLRYYDTGEYYYFTATKDLSPREFSYKSLAQKTRRTVFQAYPQKNDPSKISYYRHSAFIGQFLRLDRDWYLEITPTYHFTSDGSKTSKYRENLLKGIKQIERNPAVLGQIVMWAEYLKDKSDLFRAPYPLLSFGSLATFDIDAGIDDKNWLGHEENDVVELAQISLNELPLFS